MTQFSFSQAIAGAHPLSDSLNLRFADCSPVQDTSIRTRELVAQLAFEAYADLRKAQAAHLDLKANEHFAELCEIAFLRFQVAFEHQ